MSSIMRSIPTVQAVKCDLVDKDRWHQIYMNDPTGLVTQSPDYSTAVTSSPFYQNRALIFTFSDEQEMILPLVKSIGPNWGSAVGSMPLHWGYGGLLSEHQPQPHHVYSIWQLLIQAGYHSIRIRPNPHMAQCWELGKVDRVKAIPRKAHSLDLSIGFDQIWQNGFNSNTRRNIRKAERAGLEIETDTEGQLIPLYYKLYEASLERWAKQQNEPKWLALFRGKSRDSKEKLRSILKSLNGAGTIWMAKKDGEPVAAILVLQGQNAHYTRGVMDKALVRETRANDYLHQLAIKAACDAGCHSYFMGESGNSLNLAHFKEKLGARPIVYAEYFFEKTPLSPIGTLIKQNIKQLIGFQD